MRVVLTVTIATLAIGLAYRPIRGQMPAAALPALEAIRMVDAQIGWAMTDPGSPPTVLLRTTDGGIGWRDVTPVNPSGQKVDVWRLTALSSLIAWAPQARPHDTTVEIFRTIDGGRMWRSAAIPAPGVSSISFINPREGWLLASWGGAAVQENVEIYRSINGGETWIVVTEQTYGNRKSGLPFSGTKSSITFINPTTGWITGFGPDLVYVYVTHDGGRTWRPQDIPLPRELPRRWLAFPQQPKFFSAEEGPLPVFYHLLNESGENVGEAVALSGTHHSVATWTPTAPVSVNISEVTYHAVADMNHAWVTHGGVLHVTRDGGRQWTTIRPGSVFAGVTQLDFISPKVGWAVRNTARHGARTPTLPFLLKTLDGGITWTPATYTISK